MRAAAILLLLAGCRSPAGESLAPDEMSLWVSNTESDSSGVSGGTLEPWRQPYVGSGDSQTLGLGLTWYLDSTSAAGRHDSLLWAVERLAASNVEAAHHAPTPGPVFAPVPTQDPAHDHPTTPPTPDDERSRAVTQLIVAMVSVATLLAGYLGRQRIPVVRDWTHEGRARRHPEPPSEE